MTTAGQPATSRALGDLVARIRRVMLASGRAIWSGYDNRGRQFIAVPANAEPGALDVYIRETPSSVAYEEDRRARRARRRSLASIKAGVRNVSAEDVAVRGGVPRSREAAKVERAREILSRLGNLPEGGDDVEL